MSRDAGTFGPPQLIYRDPDGYSMRGERVRTLTRAPRKKVVIVGAGLAGSILADGLANFHETVVIDVSTKPMPLPISVREDGIPAGYFPHVGSGPGGTSAYWHNGLIAPDNGDFAIWPISKADLSKYYAQSFRLLSGVEQERIQEVAEQLRMEYIRRGVPAHLLGDFIYYPKQRRNLWTSLEVDKKPVTYLQGRVQRLAVSDEARVAGVQIETDHGSETIPADIVVCCAGGLSSPLIIRETGRHYKLSSLSQAGSHYHDHPTGFIGEIKLKLRLHDIWNYSAPGTAGVVRTPMVVRSPAGQKVAFYLRPAAIFRQKQNAFSVLNDLRNSPFNLLHIARLFSHPSEMAEIASFLLGVNLPTDTFSILIAAEQPPSDFVAVEAEQDTGGIIRRWHLDDAFKSGLQSAFEGFLKSMGPHIADVAIFPEWDKRLLSGAHHSGTCRMAAQPNGGVCDSDCKIFGIENAYICDGSVIPSTGYANTGLTIGALCLRLLEFLKSNA